MLLDRCWYNYLYLLPSLYRYLQPILKLKDLMLHYSMQNYMAIDHHYPGPILILQLDWRKKVELSLSGYK